MLEILKAEGAKGALKRFDVAVLDGLDVPAGAAADMVVMMTWFLGLNEFETGEVFAEIHFPDEARILESSEGAKDRRGVTAFFTDGFLNFVHRNGTLSIGDGEEDL